MVRFVLKQKGLTGTSFRGGVVLVRVEYVPEDESCPGGLPFQVSLSPHTAALEVTEDIENERF